MKTALVVLVLALGPYLRAGGATLRHRLRRHKARAVATPGDAVLFAEMTALALTAGLTLPQALQAASERVSLELQREVTRILRLARRHGIAPALLHARGSAVGLYRIAARAALSGAPVLPAVHGHLDELRSRERLRRVERLRKLPVKMLFPLALLILPGFLVLTVAPALLGALDRLRL